MKAKAKKISAVSESRTAGHKQVMAAPTGAKITGQKHSDAEGGKSAAQAPKLKW